MFRALSATASSTCQSEEGVQGPAATATAHGYGAIFAAAGQLSSLRLIDRAFAIVRIKKAKWTLPNFPVYRYSASHFDT